ncbi:MAG: hypothetical protein IKV43_04735, partial [Clostridia bacterium]|nr:hypothetical protein [Clostridia bacterium]
MCTLHHHLAASSIIFILTVFASTFIFFFNRRRALLSDGLRKFPVEALHVLTGGVVLSAAVMVYPIAASLSSSDVGFTVHLVTLQKTLQLFTADADFALVADIMRDGQATPAINTWYNVLAAVLHITAPVIFAGWVLTIFKHFKAHVVYHLFSWCGHFYYITELNDRSIALAEDIFLQAKKEKKRVRIVITDVFGKKEDEQSAELINRAEAIGCILFAKDITELPLRRLLGKLPVRKFFFIGMDEDENVQQALHVITACAKPGRNKKKAPARSVFNTSKTEFYVFSRSAESEVLLNSIDNGDMKVRRIDENRNFVLRTLMEYPIFKDALPAPEGKKEKQLNILLVGLGMIGTEYVKALSWVGQMYGYVLNLHIFDGEKDIEKRLRNIAPELIDNNFVSRRAKNDNETFVQYYSDASGLAYKERVDGEAYYNFFYYDGIDVKTQEFLDIVDVIGPLSGVYVTLGDDELNIETAMRLRMTFERSALAHGRDNRPVPAIYPVVYSEIKNEIITNHNGLRTMNNDDYGITIVGSINSSYTLAALEQDKIERAGLECHLKWASAEEKTNSTNKYSKYEYYRRSSMAEAMHAYMRKELGLMPSMLDDATKQEVFKYEHCRW